MKKIKILIILPMFIFLALANFQFTKAEEYIVDPSELPREDAFKAIVKIYTFYEDTDNYLTTSGSGSGIIIDKNGLVLTNYHVVTEEDEFDESELPTSYKVCIPQTINNKPDCKYSAKLIARNKDLDVAILKIEIINNLSPIIKNFPYLNLNSTDTTNINDKVIALGYPAIGGDTITITSGIISGKESKYGKNWIKTDAIISFGNSGGAAIDENGNIIGITSRTHSDLVGSLGYITNINSLNSWINQNKNLPPQDNHLLNKTKNFIKRQNILETAPFFLNENNPYLIITKPEGWVFSFEQESIISVYNENDEDSGYLELEMSKMPYFISVDHAISIYKSTITIPTAVNFNKIEDVNINGRWGKKLLISRYGASHNEMENIYLFPVQNILIQISYDYGKNDKDKTNIDNMINSLITRDSDIVFNEIYEYVNQDPVFSIKTKDNLPIAILNSKTSPIVILNKTNDNFFAGIKIEKTNDNSENLSNEEYLDNIKQMIQTSNQMGTYLDIEFKIINSNAHYSINNEIKDAIMLESEIYKPSEKKKIIHSINYFIKIQNAYINISLTLQENDTTKINNAKKEFNEMVKSFSLTDTPNIVNYDHEDISVTKPVNQVNQVYDKKLATKLMGKLLLQVEDKGRIWYVNPGDSKRYEVTFANALPLFEKLSLGISNKDLNQISENKYTTLGNRLKGKLLLQVEDKGRIWYRDLKGMKHEVTWDNLMDLFTKLSLGITNANLDKIQEGFLE